MSVLSLVIFYGGQHNQRASLGSVVIDGVPMRNSSIHLSFREAVKVTYAAVKPCLTLTGTLNTPHVQYQDDLEDHFKEVIQVTSQFRGLPPHEGSGNYSGMWIENLYIKHFIGKPFTFFNGMIPLFVQWSDYNLYHHYTDGMTEDQIFRPIADILRKDVLYVAVSQANYGIEFINRNYPNVLMINAGGEGNIAIPLIKGEIPYIPMDYTMFPQWDVGFYGSIDHGHRKKILDSFMKVIDKTTKFKYKIGPSKTWIQDM